MLIFHALFAAIVKTFDYTGRSERLEHWTFLFFTAWVCTFLYVLFSQTDIPYAVPFNFLIVGFVFWLLLANLSLAVRRLHDHGRSGLWFLWYLLPLTLQLVVLLNRHTSYSFLSLSQVQVLELINGSIFWILLVMFSTFFVQPGQKDDNDYGSPP